MRVTATRAGTATIGGVLLANHLPVLAAVFGLIAAIFLGVALPAVWSAKPARRAAALATLKVLLAIVKRPAPMWRVSADLTGPAAFAAEHLTLRSCPVVG